MTHLVVDSSVAVKWFLAEPLEDKAHEILEAFNRQLIEIVVPDILHAEVANVLWRKHQFDGFDRDDCETHLDDLDAIALPFVPISRLFLPAFRLASAYRRTVYDMLYVALAERERCPFVTADEKLVNAVASSLPSVIFLASWRAQA